MRSSKWHALGNTYWVVEGGELTPEGVRSLVRDADGIVEVVTVHEREAHVVIWNRDGSVAELSGNGVRIAARWLAERTGAERVRVRVGTRELAAQMLAGADVETEMGEVAVGQAEVVEDIEFVPVSVGNPHAVVRGDPADVVRVGPLLEAHPRFPERTNVEVARLDGSARATARVWERGVGETAASGTGAIAVAAALIGDGETVVVFPGGPLHVRLAAGRARLTGAVDRIE